MSSVKRTGHGAWPGSVSSRCKFRIKRIRASNKTPPGEVDSQGVDADVSYRSAKHTDELLDQALADSFPASDPVSTLSTATPPATDVDA
jgi:hypothetical protein